MEDSWPVVVPHAIASIGCVIADGVGPQARTVIVVNPVVIDDEVGRVEEFRPARFPVWVMSVSVVVVDLVVADPYPISIAKDPYSPVVMNMVPSHGPT